jgi:hypothetical protein
MAGRLQRPGGGAANLRLLLKFRRTAVRGLMERILGWDFD